MTGSSRAKLLLVSAVLASALIGCSGSSPSPAPTTPSVACSSQSQSPLCASSDPAPSGSGFTPLTGDNVMPVSVIAPNVPVVSVQICTHGTDDCQSVSNVLLDTGSYGLRIFKSAISSVTPTQYTVGGQSIGECTEFGSANTWGSIQLIDLAIDGQTLSNFPFQQIDDTFAGGPPASTACAQMGSVSTATSTGWNGILGVGQGMIDCPECTVRVTGSQGYFACTGNSCKGVTVSAANQVQNPVPSLAKDGNGLLIELPQVSSGGAGSATGFVAFGIGTQSNNKPSNWGISNVFGADQNLMMRTVYNGQTYDSIIDSGSNSIFLPDCFSNDSSGYLVPLCSVNLVAMNQSARSSTSSTVAFQIANANTLTGVAYNNLGGTTFDYPGIGPVFDWGLPFFFGRTVFVGVSGRAAAGGELGGAIGPYWAY